MTKSTLHVNNSVCCQPPPRHWQRHTELGLGAVCQVVSVCLCVSVLSATEAGQKRRKEDMPVYEQAENVDNPLRCPVKLYEFYLSKWLVCYHQIATNNSLKCNCNFSL